tara:strand:+ start:63 stop:179 length:117 start_codon:yes stop_codon:yes gene_type:complete
MTLPKLEDMYVSEHTEEMYAQIIAEEDIKEIYGEDAIV